MNTHFIELHETAFVFVSVIVKLVSLAAHPLGLIIHSISYMQHGFKKNHSTTTLLTNLTEHILYSFNQNHPPKRTWLATIDINKAFDTISKHILKEKIVNTTLHANDKKRAHKFPVR